MGLPRTAIGIFGFVIFAGFLIAVLFSGSPDPNDTSPSSLNGQIQAVTDSQKQISESALNLSECSGTYGIFCSISGVFEIIYNILIIVLNFIALIFLSMAGFVTAVLGIPFLISGILITLLLIGSIFALISKLVEI